jgi:hypothetical protein
MFKTVEYAGFEGNPDLRIRAEQLTPVLAGEVRGWQDDVEVRWSPASGTGRLALTLSLALKNGVSGTAQRILTSKDLSDDDWSAIRCGQAWSDVLGEVSRRQMSRVEELLVEPAEA